MRRRAGVAHLVRSRVVVLTAAATLVGGTLAAAPATAQDAAAAAPEGGLRPEEPFQELPMLTWQEEMELQSTVRQVIFNCYLPLLARPTDYRGVHDDSIPNQVGDWNWHRPDVRNELKRRQDIVDRQRRAHAALPDAEVNHLRQRSVVFRPEELEPLLTSLPRFEDLVVTLRRVQPLGGEVFRVDFDVTSKSNGAVETTKFDAVDLVRQGGIWLLPTRVLFEIAPLARAQAQAATGQPLDPIAAANNFIAIAQNTLNDVLPFDIPQLPRIPTLP